jgi:hypothetical protein
MDTSISMVYNHLYALVIERALATGRFNFKSTRPAHHNPAKLIYAARVLRSCPAGTKNELFADLAEPGTKPPMTGEEIDDLIASFDPHIMDWVSTVADLIMAGKTVGFPTLSEVESTLSNFDWAKSPLSDLDKLIDTHLAFTPPARGGVKKNAKKNALVAPFPLTTPGNIIRSCAMYSENDAPEELPAMEEEWWEDDN